MTNPSPSAAIEFSGVSKTFSNGTHAVAPVSLNIAQGEFVSLVGPSGCGKSTLLRLAAGLSAATTGTIAIGSKPQPEIGFVFQEPTLMPWATVTENVLLPVELKGRTADSRTRAADAIELVGLTEFASAYPRELSGGMKMRVSIARALIMQPDLLLLDEPFAALDEFTRAKLNEDLLALWEDQRWTAVFVTHSIREAAYLSDRIVVMSPRPGRIIADVSVPFPHPRRLALRDDHAFTDFCAGIATTLGEALMDIA
jgi:NitT/TauT family transport system ATP-binding protein